MNIFLQEKNRKYIGQGVLPPPVLVKDQYISVFFFWRLPLGTFYFLYLVQLIWFGWFGMVLLACCNFVYCSQGTPNLHKATQNYTAPMSCSTHYNCNIKYSKLYGGGWWFHCDYTANSAQLHWDLGWAWQQYEKRVAKINCPLPWLELKPIELWVDFKK